MSHDLNPPQREAVETLSGPMLVLAGAGTGKTRVVTYRIANLIRNRVLPERILAVTFTNKAAAEMRERAMGLLGKKRKKKPEISTFHSLCVRVLRRHITHLGYPKQFAICDRGDQESLARAALREIKAPSDALRPGDLLYFISRWKSAAVRPQQASSVAETDKEHLASVAYRRYQDSLKARGAVDFDDLLLLTEELFTTVPAARREEADRFDHLLVDEYQDTNGSQYRIVKALASGHRNLCVVGDDDQSIYGWRGAEVAHILRFHHDWPGAKVVRLEDNYRSTAAILKMANELIVFNRNRHDKELIAARHGGDKPKILQFPDEGAEAEGVVADLKRRITEPGVKARDFAILFRTNEQPRAFEMELRQEKIPYVLIGGMSFYDRKEVRDLLAYLKLLDNPEDETALLRIINTPPRGIGQGTVKKMLAAAVESGKPLWGLLPTIGERVSINRPTSEAIEKFRGLIDSYRARLKSTSLSKTFTAMIADIRYEDELTRIYPDPNDRAARLASIEEVVNTLAAYEAKSDEPTARGFLDHVALGDREDNDDKEKQLDRDAVALMTLHSAKGLEFPQVYLVGMEENILPHHRSVVGDDDAIDEERRLCYVGVTRAQDRLTISLSLSRRKWGKSRETHPSRFLYEMTGQADRFDPAQAAAVASGKPRSGARRSKPTPQK